MSNEQIINIPEIQQEIRNKHKKFLDKFGSLPQKVAADHRLLADKILSKLFRIVVCFKEEKIIDNAKIVENGLLKKIYIKKDGYDNYIYIITNGISVALEGYNYSYNDFASDVNVLKKRFDNINDEDYNWIDFSSQLLDHIHSVIYERQESAETHLESMLKGDGIDRSDMTKIVRKNSESK